MVPEPAKSIAAFRLAYRKDPLSQHAVLIPDLLCPDPRQDLPSIVEAIAEQAKRPDLQVGKGDLGGLHRTAGIRIAHSVRGKVDHHVQRHAIANRIAVDAKLNSELSADLAGDFGRLRDEMPIGRGADCAGRRQLAIAGRRAHRLTLVGARIGDGNAENGRCRGDHGCSLCRGHAGHDGEQRYDQHRQPHETSRVRQAANSFEIKLSRDLDDLLWEAVYLTGSRVNGLFQGDIETLPLRARSVIGKIDRFIDEGIDIDRPVLP